MAFLENPKLLYFVRLLQIFFSTAFLVLVCFAGTHRGWWNNLDGPLALGIIAVLFTFAVSGHTCWQQLRGSNPFSGRGTIYTIARLVIEILTFLLWVGTAVLALRPHGGCDPAHRGLWDGKDACFKHTDKADPHWRYTDQPTTTWIIAIACSFVEIVTFVGTIFLVFKDNRANKVAAGGTTYGA